MWRARGPALSSDSVVRVLHGASFSLFFSGCSTRFAKRTITWASVDLISTGVSPRSRHRACIIRLLNPGPRGVSVDRRRFTGSAYCSVHPGPLVRCLAFGVARVTSSGSDQHVGPRALRHAPGQHAGQAVVDPGVEGDPAQLYHQRRELAPGPCTATSTSFGTKFRALLSSTAAHTRRAPCSTSCTYWSGADRGL